MWPRHELLARRFVMPDQKSGPFDVVRVVVGSPAPLAAGRSHGQSFRPVVRRTNNRSRSQNRMPLETFLRIKKSKQPSRPAHPSHSPGTRPRTAGDRATNNKPQSAYLALHQPTPSYAASSCPVFLADQWDNKQSTRSSAPGKNRPLPPAYLEHRSLAVAIEGESWTMNPVP